MNIESMPSAAMPERLLTQDETASILSLANPRTLAAWRMRRQGPPYVKLGASVRYSPEALRAWIASRTVAV